ncbi:hypothetical protein EOD39_18211 [Acipenser ruthenus]|uniref:Uncharacterized protein n=1 Tax=Acipenser ruthenus TaxID=7906 RepID=A0A444V199_ACIRT|nr:hypothetical protein EOD39_18211 [Acipenser ruthenus]
MAAKGVPVLALETSSDGVDSSTNQLTNTHGLDPEDYAIYLQFYLHKKKKRRKTPLPDKEETSGRLAAAAYKEEAGSRGSEAGRVSEDPASTGRKAGGLKGERAPRSREVERVNAEAGNLRSGTPSESVSGKIEHRPTDTKSEEWKSGTRAVESANILGLSPEDYQVYLKYYIHKKKRRRKSTAGTGNENTGPVCEHAKPKETAEIKTNKEVAVRSTLLTDSNNKTTKSNVQTSGVSHKTVIKSTWKRVDVSKANETSYSAAVLKFDIGKNRKPVCYSDLPSDDGVLPFRRKKKVERSVSWADDDYWVKWNGWDEVIDWGDTGDSPLAQEGGSAEKEASKENEKAPPALESKESAPGKESHAASGKADTDDPKTHVRHLRNKKNRSHRCRASFYDPVESVNHQPGVMRRFET